MAELIAVGTAATTFATGEFTVAAGSQVSLLIKGAADGGIPADVEFEIARKTSGGQYTVLLTLDSNNLLDKGLINGGSSSITYAARRLLSTTAGGLDYA